MSSDIDCIEVAAHLCEEFDKIGRTKFLLIGHAHRSDVPDDAHTMTGRILERLKAWGIDEITLLPSSQAPCRADGYVERRVRQIDIAAVSTCLLPYVPELVKRLLAGEILFLGGFAGDCASAAISGHVKLCKLARVAHPSYWERFDKFDFAFNALNSRLSLFMTKDQLTAVVKEASRTPHRNNMPRSDGALESASSMGRRHVEDMAQRRLEQQIGTNVEEVRRRINQGQMIVQICHELVVSSRTMLKTLANPTNKHEKELRSALANDSNDEEIEREVDVKFLTFARGLGFSAHNLSILSPQPVSWKNVRTHLSLKGNVAREVDDLRLNAYEDSAQWLTTDNLIQLVNGAGSIDRVARVLLPPKSSHLKEWIEFLSDVMMGKKQSGENPRVQQSYLSPAARKRRRLANASIAEGALPPVLSE
jgi:hypothetical protein